MVLTDLPVILQWGLVLGREAYYKKYYNKLILLPTILRVRLQSACPMGSKNTKIRSARLPENIPSN